jgi:predicted Fe-Mo cluster-binding NifX family protein
MKGGKPFFAYIPVIIAGGILLVFLLVTVPASAQNVNKINWMVSTEVITPTVLFGLALTIYLVRKDHTANKPNLMETLTMKIAAITDDGKTISQHFGRAQYYQVCTVENGQIVTREMREKLGHSQFASDPHAADVPGQPHGMDSASHDKHILMAQAILDCKALLCRGMGMGAYESMKVAGIQPVVTDIADIDEAVKAYIDGKIVDLVERLH